MPAFDVRVVLVYEAGYEGFRLARRLEGEDVQVVVCDPVSLEVVRRRKKAKTDRIDARKMVRALRAWDGGDRDAMSPVRVPSVEEEDAKRLLRRRERLVKERTRIRSAIGGLVPVPWASGCVNHDQGTGKAGNPMLRKHLIRMAWRWLKFQPDSALSQWFATYISARVGRSRKRAIVALARKLLVALWWFATTGLVPEGAVLSSARS